MATEYTLDTLINDLKRNTYTPKTQEQLQQQAQNRYQSVYDQKRLDVQQAAETTGLALDRQLSQLGARYDKQREASQQDYAKAQAQITRNAQQRGMQRSSYLNATQGNLAIAGNKAQQEITDAEGLARGGIEDQQTLLARQLADQLKQYSASQAADTLAYIDELEGREYERGEKSRQYDNSLAAQIYQFASQEKQQTAEQERWAQQFNESVRQYDQSFAQQTRQWETQFAEGIRQFDAGLSEQQKARQQSQEQWLKQFEESVRQNDTKMAEQIRQFNASLSLDEKKLSMNAEQWEKQFAEGVRQFDIKNPQGGAAGYGGTSYNSGTKPAPQNNPQANRDAFDQEVLGAEQKALDFALRHPTLVFGGAKQIKDPVVRPKTTSTTMVKF